MFKSITFDDIKKDLRKAFSSSSFTVDSESNIKLLNALTDYLHLYNKVINDKMEENIELFRVSDKSELSIRQELKMKTELDAINGSRELDAIDHSKEFEKFLKSKETRDQLGNIFDCVFDLEVENTMGILKKNPKTENDFYRVSYLGVRCKNKETLEDCFDKLRVKASKQLGINQALGHLKGALCIELPIKYPTVIVGERFFLMYLAYDIITHDRIMSDIAKKNQEQRTGA